MISYHMISYHMISYHIISQPRPRLPPRPRPCDANETGNFFQKLYPGKMNFKKSQNIEKKTFKKTQENSVPLYCWITTRFFFSNQFRLLSIFKENRFFVSGLAIRARAPPISLQSGEPRTLRHCKTHTKWPSIFVPAAGIHSTGP